MSIQRDAKPSSSRQNGFQRIADPVERQLGAWLAKWVAGVPFRGGGEDAGLAGNSRDLAAPHAAAVDFAADQGASGGSEDRTRRPFAMSIDGTAKQCTSGGADDEAGRAVGSLAAIAALRIFPDPALVIAVLCRGGRCRERWCDERGSGQHGD